ncbi:MAG: LptE family protein [Bacteroidetes bacterium]|nr:LptE family protein [Bacteroidota bacterium]
MRISKFYIFLLLLLGSAALIGCGIYSFSGSSINAKTINIGFIENKAEIVDPQLAQTFTESLRDKFLSETQLSIVKDEADVEVTGFITRYATSFLAVKGDEPAKTRLTMAVKLKFVNKVEEGKDIENTFQAVTDFDASDEFTSIQDQLNEEVIDQILTDFFNATVNDW